MGTGEFRRRYERKAYSSEVIFSHQGRAYPAHLRDISMGGAFVFTLSAHQVSPRDIITISIPFTNGKQNTRRRARVIWTNNDGFAIEFL